MIYAILCSIALFAAGSWLLYRNSQVGYLNSSFLAEILGGITTFIGAVGLVGCLVLAVDWVGSAHKANIVNREYGTDYSREEVFYGSSVIDTIRELDRKRYEVNGDIRRQRDAERNLPKK